MPQSTIVTALQKGIGGTSFSTIMTICKVLGIKPVLGEQGIFLDRESRQLLERYMLLDERGRQTVLALTEVEVLRATADPLYDNLLKRADEVAQPKA